MLKFLLKKICNKESLSNLNEILDPEKFFRVHKSAIIGLSYIQEIVHLNFSEIDEKMKDEKLLSVSKTLKRKFFKKPGI